MISKGNLFQVETTLTLRNLCQSSVAKAKIRNFKLCSLVPTSGAQEKVENNFTSPEQ